MKPKALNSEERERQLQSIKRFSLFDSMYYRSDILIHSKRVRWMIAYLLPYAEKVLEIDSKKVMVLAHVHDDAEMKTGDIQLGDKRMMSKEQLQQMEDEEKEAIEELVKEYDCDIEGYDYKELLIEAQNKSSIEAQLVSFADKWEAFGDSLHEIFAGNVCFSRGQKHGERAYDVYREILHGFAEKFPALRPLWETDCLLVYPIPELDIVDEVTKHTSFTKEDYFCPKGYWPYDIWLFINMAFASADEQRYLYEKVE